MRWTPNYHQACRIQDKIMMRLGIPPTGRPGGKAIVIDPKTVEPIKPVELASLAKAWDTLEERKRILRMKPAPKAIDVTVKEKRRELPMFKE